MRKYLSILFVALFTLTAVNADAFRVVRHRSKHVGDYHRKFSIPITNLLLYLNQGDHRTGTSAATWDDLTGYSIAGQDNDMEQATAGSQPTVYGQYRDFDGSADYLYQAIYDTEQGNLSYSTEGADDTWTDDAQDFTDWLTTSGDAVYAVQAINDDATKSWAYLGNKVSNTEIRVFEDRALTTAGWNSVDDTGKTPLTYNIIKSDFHDISAAMTISMWVKPDDGQPGIIEFLGGQHVRTSGLRKYSIYLNLDGTVGVELSVDGEFNNETEQTDAAVFPNGATSWTNLAVVYDGSNPDFVIYVNGVAVDSTTGGGGIPATLHDSPALFVIGSLSTPASYFAGLIDDEHFHGAALTSAQIYQIWSEERNQDR